jgi:uncharacterized protein (TIGR02270 family)
MVIKEIITEFAEEAAFLWHRRTRAVTAPQFSLEDLVKLDERLEAHIDGLRVAGEAGLATCEISLGSEMPEEYFAPSVLAIESGIKTRLQAVLDAIGEDPAKALALISALGWLPYEQAEPHINNLLSSASPFHRYIGIAAIAVHRRDPGHHLDQALEDYDPLLTARVLRAYGELGREIKLNNFSLRNKLSDNDDGIRFSTAWSAALAGNSEAVEVLKNFVAPKSAYCDKALNLVLRRMRQSAALSFQKHLANSPDTFRPAVIGAGIIGDPILVPWLIEQMMIPSLARVAGEAFTMITGSDIDHEELRGTLPEGFNAGPNDDPNDSNVDPDADGDLPWPNGESITRWWNKYKKTFPGGTRHLLGVPISVNQLRHVLKTGHQRQRSAAALELAISEPGRPLFEVRAPGIRQSREVANL